MFGCFSLSLSSPRMRSLVFFFWRVAWETAGSGGMKIEWENGQLASFIWDVLAVWNELETNRGIWPTQEEALTNIKWEAYIKQATTMSTYWWENPDKGWLWSMIFPWNVAGAPVEPAPTTNEELTHGTKPAPSFTHWRDYQWWLDLLLYPMSNVPDIHRASLPVPFDELLSRSTCHKLGKFSQAFSPDVPLKMGHGSSPRCIAIIFSIIVLT